MKLSQIVLLTGLLIGCGSAAAQTRYVSDELVITLRTGPSNQNAITRNLTSGTRVQVLQELPDDGYARVRLDNGTEGWVLTQYLQPDETGDQLFEAAARERDAALAEVAELAAQVQQLQAELGQTQGALDEASTLGERLNAELGDIRSASAGALETRDQNESLRRRVAELTAAADLDEAEIRELRSRNRQSWFVVGAAVLFGGIVIGLVAPSLRRKRRSNW